MASDDRKNVSFRLPIETINQIEEIRQIIEQNTNKMVPIGIEISKTKALEVIIGGFYEDIMEQVAKQKENDKASDNIGQMVKRVVEREDDENSTLE